jgi:plastocyanin
MMPMLRLLYLLLRQVVHREVVHREVRRERGVAVYTAPTRRHRGIGVAALAIGATALVAGAGTALVVTQAGFRDRPGAFAAAPARTATLELRVDALAAAPLVAYLEAPGAAAAVPPGEQAAAVRITSVNNTFQPSFQVAPMAASVEVGNQDPVPHNTHVFDGERTVFNVAVPLSGIRVHKVLGRPGIFEVRCDFHPWMRAWLFVPSGPHHAVVWTPGAASLREIPPGSYRLHVWTPGQGHSIRTLSFGSGDVKSLQLSGA